MSTAGSENVGVRHATSRPSAPAYVADQFDIDHVVQGDGQRAVDTFGDDDQIPARPEAKTAHGYRRPRL